MDIDGRLLGSPQWKRMHELYTKAYGRFLSHHPFKVGNYLMEDEVEEYKLLLKLLQ